jgi:putative holliday junction resolvase
MSRVLALDFGEARCGCALSDPTGTLATPLEAVERPDTRRGLQRLVQLVHDRDVERVVVGLPLSLSGEEGPQAVRTREWARRLAGRLRHVPVDLHDERLTTRQAERAGGRADEDSRAAAHLLESYLAAPAGSASASGGSRA